ncbi:DUF4192 family protein [Streptomyces sp. NPDC002851]
MTNHSEAVGSPGEQTITLRSPGELADALPYLMGFHPDDSVVLVGAHGEHGNFGGRVRLGIPEQREDWPSIAQQLARCLVRGSVKRGGKPDAVVVYLCREPGVDETGRQVVERLRPLADAVRMACSSLGIPVREALCLSGGRYWSYVCTDSRCCPPEGRPLAMPGTSVMAATATYAGIQVHGSLKEMEARFKPGPGAGVAAQTRALDAATAAVAPRMLTGTYDRAQAEEETLAAASRTLVRLRDHSPTGGPATADARDDALLEPDEAARLLLGLQDRLARDRAAEWMEGEDGAAALRLWRALARRCVGIYEEFAVAPLALAGWAAWSLGNEAEARVALGLALRIDPQYTFAQLLHQACNEGLDPETVRQCLRRASRDASGSDGSRSGASGSREPGGGALGATGASGTASTSEATAASGAASTSEATGASGVADPSGTEGPSGVADPSGTEGPSRVADPSGTADPSSLEPSDAPEPPDAPEPTTHPAASRHPSRSTRRPASTGPARNKSRPAGQGPGRPRASARGVARRPKYPRGWAGSWDVRQPRTRHRHVPGPGLGHGHGQEQGHGHQGGTDGRAAEDERHER